MAAKFEKAALWIPQISDPAMRQSAYRKLGESWLKTEPVSARNWINSIPISAELKNQLLKTQSKK